VRALDRLSERAWPAFVVLAALVGLGFRVFAVVSDLGVLDSDEAVVGLMARRMLDGEVQAFFWGQHYAGTVETAVAALVIAVAGPSVAALKASVALLAAVAAVLTWRVGRRLVAERAAQAAGLLLWVGPAAYVWYSTKARGFYWAALVLGLLLLLCALRVVQDGDRRRDWIAMGLVAGLGWWVSPTIAYFGVPAAALLLVHRPGRLRNTWVAVGPLLVGALPWLWHNLFTGFPSLEPLEQPEQLGYLGGIRRLAGQVAPMVVNLRRPISATWVPLGPVLYLALGLALVVAVVRRKDRPWPLVLGLVAFPFLYSVFPGRWWVGEGRYALFLTPFLVLLVAWAARRPAALVAAVSVFAVSSGVLLVGLGRETPRSVDGDIRELRAAGVTELWADYWTSYRVMYESRERITSTSALAARHTPTLRRVARSARPAWGYPRGDARAAALATHLRSTGVDVRTFRTPHLRVVVADGRVDPGTIPPELRV